MPCPLEPVNSARRLASHSTGSARAIKEHGPRSAASCVPTVPVIGGPTTRPASRWGMLRVRGRFWVNLFWFEQIERPVDVVRIAVEDAMPALGVFDRRHNLGALLDQPLAG